MTKSSIKKALKEAMSKYNVKLGEAVRIAHNNYPEKSAVIAKAEMEMIMSEMGLA